MIWGLRGRTALVLLAGLAVELAAMGLFSLADVFPVGTPGAAGAAIAVITALAAGPLVGVGVAVGGWIAFYLLVVDQATSSFFALPVWVGTALLVGLAADSLARARQALGAGERERAELRRQDAAKNQFISLASHELRAPAATIAGIATTLHLRGESLSPQQHEQLRGTLYHQAVRMTRLLEQLLDLSRLEAEAIEIAPEPFFVRTRVEEILLFTGADGASGVTISVPPDLQLVADSHAFDRIVSNLLTNALRYGAPPIVVSAEQNDRHFRLTVEDRGPGVAPDFVPRLFDRFARGERSSGDDGTGLGLAIAQSYATAHGGRVLFVPAEPSGARFQFVLPRSEKA